MNNKLMNNAIKLALKSLKLNEVPVGCVIVDAEEKIIGFGYNSSIENKMHKESFKNIKINQKLLTKIYFDSKYDVFYEREKKSFDQLSKNKNMKLTNIDFNKIPSLSKEILEKLNKHKPENLYDAGKISGITPSALFQIVKHKKDKGIKVA